MKILLVGSEFWRGSLCDSYLRVFKNLGCEVIKFDEIQEYKSVSRLTNLRFINRLLEDYFAHLMNKRLIKMALSLKVNLYIIIKGQLISPESILTIKTRTKAQLFNINPDNPFNRNRGSSSKYIRRSLLLFDCYFTWSKSLISKLNNIGAKRVEYLPFGFDSVIHYPINVTSEEKKVLSHDLIFVGNWEKRREAWLAYLKDFDLAVWGADYWRRRCKNKWLTTRWQGREVRREQMSRVLNASRISLNILRQQNVGSINMRTFEAPACRAFVLAESSPEVKEFFEEDKEAVYFSNPEELREKANYYLKHDKERENIAQAGYRRCIESGYSYLDRAKQVLRAYEGV